MHFDLEVQKYPLFWLLLGCQPLRHLSLQASVKDFFPPLTELVCEVELLCEVGLPMCSWGPLDRPSGRVPDCCTQTPMQLEEARSVTAPTLQ